MISKPELVHLGVFTYDEECPPVMTRIPYARRDDLKNAHGGEDIILFDHRGHVKAVISTSPYGTAFSVRRDLLPLLGTAWMG